jgi:transmembrane sensor
LALAGGGAATLAAAAGFAGLALWNRADNNSPAGQRLRGFAAPVDYATKIGTTRVVALPDGSIITLNTGSKVTVKFTEHLREIDLVRGEALFTVAKNKARPFVVIAGDTRVRAVGTSFTVRYTQKQPIRILVQEGVVAVTRAGSGDTKPVLAATETQTLVPRNAPITTHTVTYTQLARGTAWQYGQISFDNDTLEEAAQEFARYSDTKIIVDSAVSARTVTGLFPSDNPVGFAKAAAAALDLHVIVGSGEVRITN